MRGHNARRLLVTALILFAISLWVPTPYVIIEPGEALSVHHMVQLDSSYEEQSGTLMLTTIRMSYANVSRFIQSFFNPNAHLYLKSSILQGQSPQEYSDKQVIYMQSSQNNAIQAAYLKAGIPYDVKLIDNVQIIEPVDQSKLVRVSADDIGGPSAGLVFALEIYNRLVPEDITRGYAIAGTGEIQPNGVVGTIGGIDLKVVAASKAGAEYFFVPTQNGPMALEQAAKIKTKMTIITVDTMEDVLHYLKGLPVK